MDRPRVVSREEWLVARRQLREKEREAAAANEALNAERRLLPMVELDKEYVFDSAAGKVTLLDMFEGRRQLIVYHFMFDPDWDEGCMHCSYLVDSVGHPAHIHARDTTLAIVSRAPQPKIDAFKARMGWTLPWYSSFGGDFNYDFHATLDEAVAPIEYDFKDKETLERNGETWFMSGEQGGLSVFYRDSDTVFHAYSTYGDGTDPLHTADNFLVLTPLGRQDDPEWRGWLRHHDRYGD
jgi:predicted dithiol-disulfide oxidoreductase (DUF899 family)